MLWLISKVLSEDHRHVFSERRYACPPQVGLSVAQFLAVTQYLGFIAPFFISYLIERSGSFFCKHIYNSLRLGEHTPSLPARRASRPEGRAEWIIFFEKRVLFEWFRDR